MALRVRLIDAHQIQKLASRACVRLFNEIEGVVACQILSLAVLQRVKSRFSRTRNTAGKGFEKPLTFRRAARRLRECHPQIAHVDSWVCTLTKNLDNNTARSRLSERSEVLPESVSQRMVAQELDERGSQGVGGGRGGFGHEGGGVVGEQAGVEPLMIVR